MPGRSPQQLHTNSEPNRLNTCSYFREKPEATAHSLVLYKPSVPAVNVLPGGGNEEQGLVQVGLRLLTAAGVAAAQLSTWMTGRMQNMSLCNLAHKSGQKVL